MSSPARKAHWENVYATRAEQEVSWFEARPSVSLDLIRATGVTTDASIIDIGGGTSHLVDALLDAGFQAITILDLSQRALAASEARLGPRAATVIWLAEDVTTWKPHVPFAKRRSAPRSQARISRRRYGLWLGGDPQLDRQCEKDRAARSGYRQIKARGWNLLAGRLHV